MFCYAVMQPHPDFPLRLVASSDALVRVNLDDLRPDPAWFRDDHHPVLSKARRQLELYFQGALRRFDLPLQPKGTPFQLRVWRALVEIPYGQTCSYADIARSLQPPSVARAVGQANGANPIGIIIPCHRVIAADGTLGGWYSDGLHRKRFLLDLEKRAAP
jgi:methylated-DNA-[protein]-cysteine S-methyltransferase